MIKRILTMAMLCMAIVSLTSCSQGVVIPKPVCEYGAMICETLTFLCGNPIENTLSKTEQDSLEIELKQFYKSLQKYVHETTK